MSWAKSSLNLNRNTSQLNLAQLIRQHATLEYIQFTDIKVMKLNEELKMLSENQLKDAKLKCDLEKP